MAGPEADQAATVLPMSNLPFDALAIQDLPEDHDPTAEGVLMQHQVEWIEDKSPLKMCPKGRRTGITYAEALDDTITAATKKSEGGDNVFYIGDTKDKGLEFINYVSRFAKVIAGELHPYNEFIFEDQQEDGSTRFIAAYRVKFASGCSVVALSSRPASIRGLQGIVVIDEAAFHKDVGQVIDAVNALLIWGGKIRIISSHNGVDNAFNVLIKDTLAGHFRYSIHTVTFDDAVKNGLYERYCFIRNRKPSAEDKAKWYDTIIRSYGNRTEARDEELFCIPRRSSGAYFSRNIIEACHDGAIPVIRYEQSDAFTLDPNREAIAREWIEQNLRPVIQSMPRNLRTALGQDFARDGDLSIISVKQRISAGKIATAFRLEMRNIPFDIQRQILFYIIDNVPLFHHAKLDARGNGQAHAEAALQKYGPERIECVMFTVAWYAEWFPKYKSAFEDQEMVVSADEDFIADHRLVVLKAGKPGLSDKHLLGSDGGQRHGDAAVAGVLAYAALQADGGEYGYQSARGLIGDNGGPPFEDDDTRPGRFGRGAW
ncbi:hypothetical protein [Ferrovibrio sp.]|uniref:hypothetical protein n=1 Tax=Ferrovibrio sp. TaxID=1917215 RepID=UPI0035ADC166